MLDYRKRHRLRRKEIEEFAGAIEQAVGLRPFDIEDTVDLASALKFDVIFVNGKLLAFVTGGEPFLTLRGLLKFAPPRRWLEVDAGAVPYICNGADVMAPGMTGFEESIVAGRLAWVRDQRFKKPLAVGRALHGAAEMGTMKKGKVLETLHFVGDDLWKEE